MKPRIRIKPRGLKPQTLTELNERYSRISKNVDFNQMLNTTLFVIGNGASGPMVEQFIRLGIKKVYLFDNKWVQRQKSSCSKFHSCRYRDGKARGPETPLDGM